MLHPACPIIGQGTYGTVYQVVHKRTMKCFACKVMLRNFFEECGQGAQIDTEKLLMHAASSQHGGADRHVVQLHAAIEEGGWVFFLLELCVHGTIREEMALNPGNRLSEQRAAQCARDLLQSLHDLHDLGIVHRDVKLDNLLISAGGVLKITDFGWAADAEESPTGLCGTFENMAPEVVAGERQTMAVDLWSAGSLIHHMVTGRSFFQSDVILQVPGSTGLTIRDPRGAANIRIKTLLDEINTSCPPALGSRPADVSEACWDLISRLMVPKADQRLTASQALQHEWLRVPPSVQRSEPKQFQGPVANPCA